MPNHINLEQLLTSRQPYHLSLPRDDMELGALQLLISLVQVLLPPEDRRALLQRVEQPLTPDEYHQAVAAYRDWFTLDHSEYPFMQSRGVKAKEITPIQKLFIGLPEGNNHAFFNARGEIEQVCGGCAAIALFNQASNCPSFGGGFKGSLRGGAPVTTLASGDDLRQTIWLNVLHRESIDKLIDADQANDQPVWVDPIVPKAKLQAHTIGLLRGLFWQPARVELLAEIGSASCDACRHQIETRYIGFRKEKFVYDLDGIWLHPHSPRVWDIKKEGIERERFVSFTTTAPAWTQLNHFVFDRETQKSGSVVAPIVQQHQATFVRGRRLRLLVAGYRNKQASVLERRHETFSMPQDWDEKAKYVEKGIAYALDVKQELRNKLYGFAKEFGLNLHDKAERQFYSATEPLIHDVLREMNFREGRATLIELQTQVNQLARDLFDDLTEPYRDDPKGLKFYSQFKSSFLKGLRKLDAEEVAKP